MNVEDYTEQELAMLAELRALRPEARALARSKNPALRRAGENALVDLRTHIGLIHEKAARRAQL